MGYVYLIRDNDTGLHKIGMTTNWERRSHQLKVGISTTQVRVIQCKDAEKWERVLHAMFNHKRIPQSEWFRITAEEANPKMNWLSEQTNHPRMIIGNWRQAKDGHFYRRRKSRYGNWYTEQKSTDQIRLDMEVQLELAITSAERTKLQESRLESGYWPTRQDTTKVEWAEKDPTKTTNQGCLSLPAIFIVIGIGMAVLTHQPLYILLAIGAILFTSNFSKG